MARKSSEASSPSLPFLLFVSLVTLSLVYTALSALHRRPIPSAPSASASIGLVDEEEGCCRGIDHLELWGPAVKWGSDFKFNTSGQCCAACRRMCGGGDGPCLCDSWVFCGDRDRCGDKLGECWLKKQKDVMHPAVKDSGDKVMWTSGLIFGVGKGIVGLETQVGVLRMKLLPECAPHSVAYVQELLGSRHCAGCQFHRAESRGKAWDSDGNHIDDASFGPPYGLIQGVLEADGIPFQGIPKEACPTVKRGSVAWVGSGPEFIISLANHDEWSRSYTVFGSVLAEDMVIAEKVAGLPTRPDSWGNINVTVLDKPLPLKLKQITTAIGDSKLSAKTR